MPPISANPLIKGLFEIESPTATILLRILFVPEVTSILVTSADKLEMLTEIDFSGLLPTKQNKQVLLQFSLILPYLYY